ncbi:FCPE, partial [Symbiodinium pilosum]
SAWGDWANYTESPLRAFENELGVQAPLGYFDPLGLSKDGDVETFRRRRESEIKNGRVAMFATIGYIVPEYFKFPGYLAPSSNLKFADVPNGLGAITKVPAEGWLQWVALCGCYELCVNQPVDPADPGNYGKGKLGYGNMVLGITAEPIADEEARTRGRNSELANGRLAMMAIVGLWVQNGLFGTPYGLYTGSSAFENELGVQPPAGFWDPLGFTKGGDAASFRRRRYVELKHGRVAMLACLGYIVPEYYRWPGDLSPSLGLKFTDVPTGFAAFSKVPLSGWAQMVAFAGSVELFQYVDDPKRAPGDFENAGYLGIPNGFIQSPAGGKEKKLSAEIANGRLAMMAIIGMFFQNGLTGTAWGDWSLYTDSPLRALTPAQELIAGTGGPFPNSFWDPAGISTRSTEKELLQLRAIELKHGRVAMLAVLHWFHVAAGYHLLGDYASGSRMSDDPLVNVTQLPMGGMWQVVFTIMCLEWLTTYVCKPPEDRPWDVLGWKGIIVEDYDSKIWNRWQDVQCQELNNGRLAMIAITGLVAQDVVTGDYVAGVGQLCGGAEICQEATKINFDAWELPPMAELEHSWSLGPAIPF